MITSLVPGHGRRARRRGRLPSALAETPSFVCAGDTVLNQGPPLAYGQSKRAAALQCDSAALEMTWRDGATGRDFSLSCDGCELF